MKHTLESVNSKEPIARFQITALNLAEDRIAYFIGGRLMAVWRADEDSLSRSECLGKSITDFVILEYSYEMGYEEWNWKDDLAYVLTEAGVSKNTIDLWKSDFGLLDKASTEQELIKLFAPEASTEKE